MSLNEYLSQKEEMVVQKKQEVLSLKTHNTLLARFFCQNKKMYTEKIHSCTHKFLI
jgi:hypothetical protein